MEFLQYLIEQCHADVNLVDKYGRTFLHDACQFGNLDTVKYFVEQCYMNVNTVDKFGCTCLHLACMGISGNLDIVQYLIEHCNANVNIKDLYGKTCLHSAKSLCYGTIRSEFLKYLTLRHVLSHRDSHWSINKLFFFWLRRALGQQTWLLLVH